MTCDQARAAFSDLYDEVLSGAPLVTITQHLASCPACRAEWGSFRKAMQAVGDLGAVEPSPGFAARVRQRAEEPTRWQRALRWLFLPLRVKLPIQAVALILAAFASLLLYQRSPELRRATSFLYQVPSAPVAPKAPAPPAPSTAGEPARKDETPAPTADALKTRPAERVAPPAATVAPPLASVQAEQPRGPSAPGGEVKELGKTAPPSEFPKTEESSRDLRAKAAEPGVVTRQPQQAPPAPAAPGGAVVPAQPSTKSLATPPSPPRASAPPAPSAPPIQAAPSSKLERERGVASTPTGTADQLYSAALADLGRQSYDRGIENLRTFIQQNPRDARLPEARLRLADAYVSLSRYSDAIPEYEALVREFPTSPLIPAALYRQAQARLALGDPGGCQALRDVADRYPQTPEAALAQDTISTRCR
jgi:TolA-binding protein